MSRERGGGRAPDRRRDGIDELYSGAVRVFAATIVAFGVAMIAVTLARGGGPLSVGMVFGLCFVALGGARLYLSLR